VAIDNDNPSINLSIPIVDDFLLEGNETFLLTLTAVNGTLVRISSVISPDVAEIVIQDNDGKTLQNCTMWIITSFPTSQFLFVRTQC